MIKLPQLAAVTFAVVCSVAPAVQASYYPPPFQGTVGHLQITNNSLYPVTITLWHPSNGQVWRQYVLLPNSTRVARDVGGAVASLGDDWGLQIGASPIKPLSRCASFQNGPAGRLFVTSTDLFATH